MRAVELRQFYRDVARVTDQLCLRVRQEPELARTVALLKAAERRLQRAADKAFDEEPIPFRLSASARPVRAVVSRVESYVEYDDGTRVPRS